MVGKSIASGTGGREPPTWSLGKSRALACNKNAINRQGLVAFLLLFAWLFCRLSAYKRAYCMISTEVITALNHRGHTDAVILSGVAGRISVVPFPWGRPAKESKNLSESFRPGMCSATANRRSKILPPRIKGLDECDLSRSQPSLDLLLPGDGGANIAERLEIHQLN